MRSDDSLAPPTGAVLLRLVAHDGSWLLRLPEVPGRRTLSVTVGGAEHRAVASTDLARLGYRVVGSTGDPRHVEVLVPVSMAEAHPAWFLAALAVADRAFDLRHGPVQRLLGPVIGLHARS